MPSTRIVCSDRGATAIFVAFVMVVLMGIAAIAIDLGFGFNERRQDQIAADTGVMAGAIDFLQGPQVITSEMLEFVWLNLPSVTGASWDTDADFRNAFLNCSDPERTALGLSLQPVTEPNNGVWAGTATLDCVSLSGLGFARVRVPDQFVETTFGRVIGFTSFSTAADAVAQLTGRSSLGVLPFGLVSGVGGGDHICLSSAPTGLAEDPCTGAAAGNFGTLKLPIWGNPEVGTTQNCNAAPLNQSLSVNIAVGADHLIFPAASVNDSDEIRDNAANCASRTFGVNALDTDTGFPSGTAAGLIGPLPGSAPPGSVPRLLNSSNTTNLFGVNIDNKPLWEYISSSADGCYPACFPSNPSNTPVVPEVCDPQTFNNASGYTHAEYADGDWNNDGVMDTLASWEHMGYCLKVYQNTGPQGLLFDGSIEASPRFSYTPQFWDATLGAGGSGWPNVRQFRTVWLQGTWWKQGNNWSAFHPGEGCDTTGGGSCASNETMLQLSGLVIPDLALPLELRGNPPPFGNINPFKPLLYK